MHMHVYIRAVHEVQPWKVKSLRVVLVSPASSEHILGRNKC